MRTFRGEVAIALSIGRDARELRLDCEALEIEGASIGGVACVWRLDLGGALVLEPASPLQPGEVTARIRFRGALGERREGLYAGDGFIATQMQPAHARRVFPCFDDPRHRCVFELAVMVDAGQGAISNAPVADGGDASARRRVVFEPSEPLPTYLFALAIGQFESLAAEGEPPLAIHALHAPARFASVLKDARAALDFCEHLLARPFPFTKLDIVVLPQTSIAGMENSGAIFLREADATQAGLVAHEAAHQWFGGLVTPRDWRDLWLNEGFATWFAAKAVPDTEAEEVRLLREALHRDGGPGARPLVSGDAHDVALLFDVTAYRKGAALLRMLEAWMGEEAFRRGLREYLDRHAFASATSDDLWLALEPVTPLPVARVAHAFATRTGAPHLVIEAEGANVRIVQATEEVWSVPVRLRVAFEGGETRVRELFLEDREATLQFERDVSWVFGNADAAGWYRCTYRGTVAPVAALSNVEAHVLIEDAWIALWQGELDLIAYLALAAGAPHAHLDEVKDLLASGARAPLFDRWLGRDASEPPAASLSDLEDPSLDEPARIAAVEALLADPATRVACWAFIKQRWGSIGARLVGWGGRGLFAGLAAFSDPAVAADIEQFFAAHALPGADVFVRATADRIAARARFREAQQATMDALLMHLDAPAGPPAQRVKDEHALLALMAAGFRGALLQRLLFDHAGIDAPAWMHTAGNLRGAAAATERQLVLVHRGAPAVRPADVELARRLIEDLQAAARHFEGALASGGTSPVLAAGLVRTSAMHEREREAELVFAALFEPARADALRRAAESARTESALWRAWLAPGAQPGPPEVFRLHSMLVPALLRLHATRLQVRLAVLGHGEAPAHAAPRRKVVLPDGEAFSAEVATDFAGSRVGLMHRDALQDREGMLFIHDDDDLRPVTMRNVRFPLDVVWLDESGTVLHVEPSVPPWRDGPFPADRQLARGRAVLELPAGSASRHGVVAGSHVRFDQ